MQITDHIHALKNQFEIVDTAGNKIPRFVYSYLIFGNRICLIDSGVAGSEEAILECLKANARSPEEISMLILTHAHPDHIGGAAAIRSLSGCTVSCHAAERSWIEDVSLQERVRPVPGFRSLVGGSVAVDHTLQDGEIIDLGDGLRLSVLHTPGHSPGSISLWLAEEGALFSADAIPVAGDMPIYVDILTSVQSIRRLSSLSGVEHLLSAWDDPRSGKEAYRVMGESLKYLQRIHSSVLHEVRQDPGLDTMLLCRRVLADLRLPETMANPLVAASFQASMIDEARSRPDLLKR
ncbi:MAG: MBL fold metallo-hydrolase [Methanothrix sp.]|nr:MBL fold metallo-hydrolase [Methanothrix sp.]